MLSKGPFELSDVRIVQNLPPHYYVLIYVFITANGDIEPVYSPNRCCKRNVVNGQPPE
ncbi:hypothetical protein [Solibacillus sp. R5-41]|uniref:hypothetical protein n=1 Tax=Solibacillus sp. R5-41 TaxID=2048654 RepID=UPI0012FE31D5|nr:hypothetical protein [Solibacillus sp. R5-41]